MPFASVEDVEPKATHFREHGGDRPDRGTGKAQIVSHAIDITFSFQFDRSTTMTDDLAVMA